MGVRNIGHLTAVHTNITKKFDYTALYLMITPFFFFDSVLTNFEVTLKLREKTRGIKSNLLVFEGLQLRPEIPAEHDVPLHFIISK